VRGIAYAVSKVIDDKTETNSGFIPLEVEVDCPVTISDVTVGNAELLAATTETPLTATLTLDGYKLADVLTAADVTGWFNFPDEITFPGGITVTATGAKDATTITLTFALGEGGITESTPKRGDKFSITIPENFIVSAETSPNERVVTDLRVQLNENAKFSLLPRAATPTIIIDYEEELLKTFDSDETYTIAVDDSEISDVNIENITSYKIPDAWMKNTGIISIVNDGDEENTWVSLAQELTIKERQAAPSDDTVTAVKETVQGDKDGKITGVTDTMEYQVKGEDETWPDTWTPVKDNEKFSDGALTGLEPGTYRVRVKAVPNTATGEEADNGQFAGVALEVTVDEGDEPARILTVGIPTFEQVIVGYEQPDAKPITISNSGNREATITKVEIPENADFELVNTKEEANTVPAKAGENNGTNATWEIKPKIGLTVPTGDELKTYSVIIIVTYNGTQPDNPPATGTVYITVNAVKYPLTIVKGEDKTVGGNGNYIATKEVSISANAPASGKVFALWTSSGGGIFGNAGSAQTTFTMSANAVTVTATYKDDLTDTDGDGVPDYIERQDGTNPNDSADFKDTDGDGVPDYVEEEQGTNPNDKGDAKDTDGDGVPDYVQKNTDDSRPYPVKYFNTFRGSGTSSAKVYADHTLFARLLYGGREVDPANYTITQGSTVITLHEDYLKTFENGTYWFTEGLSNGGISDDIRLIVDVRSAGMGGVLLRRPVTAL
jgi:hypothetical protein